MSGNTITKVCDLERMGNPFMAARLAVAYLTTDEIAVCAKQMPYDDRWQWMRQVADIQAEPERYIVRPVQA